MQLDARAMTNDTATDKTESGRAWNKRNYD